ncbi:MAG: hypothetical protein ACRDOF_03035 [Gaiellaceae bacterium]
MFEITFGPNLRALMAGALPPSADPQVPDFVPEEWGGLPPAPDTEEDDE